MPIQILDTLILKVFFVRAIVFGVYRLLFGCVFASFFIGAVSCTQPFSLSIASVSQIAVEGSVALNISTAMAGAELDSSSDSSAKLSFSTNSASSQKITATTAGPLPTGLLLSVSVDLEATGVRVNQAPGVTAISNGPTYLNSMGATIVHNINKAVIRKAPLTYNFTAQAGAGQLSPTLVTVIYLITNN